MPNGAILVKANTVKGNESKRKGEKREKKGRYTRSMLIFLYGIVSTVAIVHDSEI